MAMGITRVADQYGFAVEAQAHREQLAAYAEDAEALAASAKGFGVTAGMNDPRRMARQRQAADHRLDQLSQEHVPLTNPYTGDDGGGFRGRHWDAEDRRSGDEVQRRQAYYDEIGYDLSRQRNAPDTGHSHDSGRDYDDPPEFEHDAPREVYGDSDEVEPADVGYGDEAYDELGNYGNYDQYEPYNRDVDGPHQESHADADSPWSGGWESGLDRPFQAGINDLTHDSYGSDPDHLESEYGLNAHDGHEVDPIR